MSSVFLIIIDSTKNPPIWEKQCILQIHAADYGSLEHPNVNNDPFLSNDNRSVCFACGHMYTKRQYKGIDHFRFMEFFFFHWHHLNPYSAKGLGDRLYATLHKMPEELGNSFCLFLKS